ncbi:MAG TPA: thermonuclease family protein [Pyrinomonadaceae bacterium]|nr:thermonuclease family protein [Pyrinomonadaceae bacterium]
MNTHTIFRSLLLVVALFCVNIVASAATLQAKVIEVESGNSFVVTNINRPLKIRLKAVAPPDSRQPYSEASREHLKSLILNQTVMVEYTHLTSGYLEARVFLNGVDVGSQMLRDGVAWFDRSLQYTLRDSDREVYAQCEQMARTEKRGLWQDANPVAPWDFRKSQQVDPTRPSSEVSFNEARAALSARAARRDKSFSNHDLLGGMVGPGSIAGNPTISLIWPDGKDGDWRTFHAPRFSIRMPADSLKFEYPILDVQQKIVNINYIVGANEAAMYSVMWIQAANDGATDDKATEESLEGFLKGVNRYYNSKGWNFRVVSSAGRPVRVGNYTGKQYTLTADTFTGVLRIITRRTGDQREMFGLAVLGPGGDWAAPAFLNSLKISGN